MTTESASEFSDYLTMETFFNAESAMGAQQNFSQQNSEYLMAPPMENSYNYENSLEHHPDKFEYHNNNNVQFYYENGNPVQTQQQLISQHPPEFYVSSKYFRNFEYHNNIIIS